VEEATNTPEVSAAPGEQYYGTGRRKRSVARVFLRPGKGDFLVNGRAIDAYFPCERQRVQLRHPLQVVELADRFDVLVNVHGGGLMGQAEAARLGISRAIQLCNLELRGKLKKIGFLSRDSRSKERKKYGQKGARKRFQFSKR
jgi:small subunit ribosomal protein S9